MPTEPQAAGPAPTSVAGASASRCSTPGPVPTAGAPVGTPNSAPGVSRTPGEAPERPFAQAAPTASHAHPADAIPCEALAGTPLFRGIDAQEVAAMLACLGARHRTLDAGEYAAREGDPARSVGLVVAGSVVMERTDLWGARSILGRAAFGETFGEAYVCVPGSTLGVDVRALEPTAILALDVERVLKTCPSACLFHARLVRNLLGAIASKNLQLSEKIQAITPRTIRARVLSYLEARARQAGSRRFAVPFNRQQLADYLCVDRSALSHELAKMRADGLLDYDRTTFELRGPAAGSV